MFKYYIERFDQDPTCVPHLLLRYNIRFSCCMFSIALLCCAYIIGCTILCNGQMGNMQKHILYCTANGPNGAAAQYVCSKKLLLLPFTRTYHTFPYARCQELEKFCKCDNKNKKSVEKRSVSEHFSIKKSWAFKTYSLY